MPWTAKDDAVLRKMRGTMEYQKIADHLGRSLRAVMKRAQVLGLTKEHPIRRDWTESEEKQLRKLYGKISPAEIAQRLNRSVGAVEQQILMH